MRKELEAQLAAQLHDEVVCVEKTDQRTIFIDVKREAIRRAVRIVTEAGGRYMCGVGYDNIARDGTLGMVHTFSMDRNDYFICVRTKVPAIDPVMESITPDLPSAGWSEREFMDMLGMQFTNHPKPKRLVLADDWPAGIYPLRKEVPYDLVPPGAEDVAYQLDEAPPGHQDRPHRPLPSQPARARALRRLCRWRDHQGLRLSRLHDPSRHREALPDPGQLQRGALHRRAHLRHLRFGACHGLLAGGRIGRRHQDPAPRRIHPHPDAGDRADPLAPAVAGGRRPPDRLRHRVHAGLAGARAIDVAVRAPHRQPQDLRHDPDRRRAPRHHPGDRRRHPRGGRRRSRRNCGSSTGPSKRTARSTSAPRAWAPSPGRRPSPGG